MTSGPDVVLAWSLPSGPRPSQVALLRADAQDPAFVRLAVLDAADLGYVDSTAVLGRTYYYRLEAIRGAARALSPVTEIAVGGGARVRLVGGSPSRAVFEVTLLVSGRRLSQVFAHKPNQPIGDFAYVPELDRLVDFRVGGTLRELSLTRTLARETARLALADATGRPLTDLAGNAIALDFQPPGAERESLSAIIEFPGARFLPLLEGQSLTAP